MEKKRRKKIVSRWTVISTVVMVSFWFVWWLIKGSVPPVANQIDLLPFTISRWWDIIFIPLLVAVWSRVLTKDRDIHRLSDMLALFLSSGFLGGTIIFTLFYGSMTGPIGGLVCSLFFGLLIGILIGPRYLSHLPCWKKIGYWFTIIGDWLSAKENCS